MFHIDLSATISILTVNRRAPPPLTAGARLWLQGSVLPLLLLHTYSFVGLISRFEFHKLETFYLLNLGADTRKLTKTFFCLFFILENYGGDGGKEIGEGPITDYCSKHHTWPANILDYLPLCKIGPVCVLILVQAHIT